MIELTGVSKFFGDFQALKGVSLSVQPGERVVVCGPSGSGKSTMIRCINRLEAHNGGTIRVNGIELPEPDGPQITIFSPSETSRSMFRKT